MLKGPTTSTLDVVKLAQRPNTVGPDGAPRVELSAEELRRMTDDEVRFWANDKLGLAISPAATRGQILTKMGCFTDYCK